jgi:phosphoribosylglycinamide formyltransferase-1
MVQIAIFLSGSGSNAEKICQYFEYHHNISVVYLLSNNVNSGAKRIGEQFNIPYLIFNREDFYNGAVVSFLKKQQIDVVVLAGFLWLVPPNMLQTYEHRIINIHPALLPRYGGKGMYGMHIHQAVYQNKEKKSGITIHLCNEEFDKGTILFQKKVELCENDTPESIAKKVLELEHQYFSKVIESFCEAIN